MIVKSLNFSFVLFQASNSQSLDDVVEYFTGIDQGLSRPGQGVFKPGWEVRLIFLLHV
jgi:hypothetical protein